MPEHWTPAFLAALALSPNVTAACRAAGIGRRTAYDRQKADPEFAQAWEDAVAASVDRLEAAAFARAEAESDTLAKFLLAAHRRELYGERTQHEHTGGLKITVRYADPRPDDDDDGDRADAAEASPGPAADHPRGEAV